MKVFYASPDLPLAAFAFDQNDPDARTIHAAYRYVKRYRRSIVVAVMRDGRYQLFRHWKAARNDADVYAAFQIRARPADQPEFIVKHRAFYAPLTGEAL